MYSLSNQTIKAGKIKRVYRNEQGIEVKTSEIYTDRDGTKWFGFDDLFKIPIMRLSMSRHISDLFTMGLSLKDILDWCNQEKKLIRSDDPDKYEKLYSLILEKERLANYTADPVRQHLALCTVYVLADNERIDYFDEEQSSEKLKLWAGMVDAIPFFLTWYNVITRDYIKDLKSISQTVLKQTR
jgi:hypothetical protein